MKLNDLMISRGHFRKGPLNFNFESPGLYFISGQNGAGKTTLFKTILGRLRPESGSIEVKGPIASSGVEPILFSEWTIEENARWLKKISGSQLNSELPKSLSEFKSFRMEQLSSGWKRYAELLITMSLDVPTFILDEPFSYLDKERVGHVKDRISELSKSHLVVITDHQGIGSEIERQRVFSL